MQRFFRWVVLTLMVSGLSVAASAQSEPLKVVASFSVLADVVQNVGLNGVEVTSLIPVGADPHSYEPSAQDLRVLAEADVIFVVGAGFEEGLLEAIENTADGSIPVVEASACVPVRAFGAHDHDEHADEEHADEEHADEHGDEEHADEAHTDEHADEDHTDEGGLLDFDTLCAAHDAYLAAADAEKGGMLTAAPRTNDTDEVMGRLHELECGGHDDHEGEEHADEAEGDHAHEEGACDPHVWSDPNNVYYWALTISDTLGALDSTNAQQYAANAEEYIYLVIDHLALNLYPLIEAIPAENRVLVTNHETLGYFAAAYGFEMVGFVLPGGSAFAEPSAQDIVALVELIRAEGVPAVFAETTISASVAEQVAAEAGVAFYGLYTDSLSAPDGAAATYLDYLTYNIETIAQALAGE
ncbi:MAG: zinc ABC transporter substrate-binding protein [Anaerolineae bacterium]|jgi:ABC-type Zn uptake system ZnuABC Zn-binding protein ZnuA|nr:zinc ABC transporter substrate-binding protein [Anaerolineae bacterium]